MKKKPELLKRTGKSSLGLRNFLNNLKENDLHYENKQITQCVFLGVLRLKPVPSIFSTSNVPSVSAPIENKFSRRIKNNNSNKELNKNVSKKNDINKVINGKVSKKNPQKVKAAVKKVLPKKPNIIKIKLTPKKKVDKKKIILSTNEKPEHTALTISPETFKINSSSIVKTPTLALKPLMSPTKFNPVQNLFDKLKQKIGESNNEAGSSAITKQIPKLDTDESTSKACKINVKRQLKPVIVSKKIKKAPIKKPPMYERFILPVKSASPITISDTESVGKKEDIIDIDEISRSPVSLAVENVGGENTSAAKIYSQDDPKPVKQKERTSPRLKNGQEEIKFVKQIENESPKNIMGQDRIQYEHITGDHLCPSNESNNFIGCKSNENFKNNDSNDLTLISNVYKTPKTEIKPVCEGILDKEQSNSCVAQEKHKNNYIAVDEVKEVRVSPRLRKDKPRREEILPSTTSTDVIFITEDISQPYSKERTVNVIVSPHQQNFSKKSSVDKSKTQMLNITIDDQLSMKMREKSSPRLLKTIDACDKSVSIATGTDEITIITEKPKQKKCRIKSPSIPAMFLKAPRLLRSELAPKKPTTHMTTKPKVSKPRTSRLRRSELTETNPPKVSPLKLVLSTSASGDNIEYKITNPVDSLTLRDSRQKVQENQSIQITNTESKKQGVTSTFHQPNIALCKEKYTHSLLPLKKSTEKIIDHSAQQAAKHSKDISIQPETIPINLRLIPSLNVEKEKSIMDLVKTKEKPTTTRLLRSELPEQNLLQMSQKKCKEYYSYNGKLRENYSRLWKPEETQENSTKKEKMQEDNSSHMLSPEFLVQKNREISFPNCSQEIVNKTERQHSSKSQNKNRNKNILVVNNMEIFAAPRTLRSDIAQQKNHDKTGSSPDQSILLKTRQHVSKYLLPEKARQNNYGTKMDKFSSSSHDDIIVTMDESNVKKHISPKVKSPLTQETVFKVAPINSNQTKICATSIQQSIENEVQLPKVQTKLSSLKPRERSPQKISQIDLDEIIVVSEKRSKKPRERSSGRLLRSEIIQKPREKSPIKVEAEVVVLIHDEPKQLRLSGIDSSVDDVAKTSQDKGIISPVVPENLGKEHPVKSSSVVETSKDQLSKEKEVIDSLKKQPPEKLADTSTAISTDAVLLENTELLSPRLFCFEDTSQKSSNKSLDDTCKNSFVHTEKNCLALKYSNNLLKENLRTSKIKEESLPEVSAKNCQELSPKDHAVNEKNICEKAESLKYPRLLRSDTAKMFISGQLQNTLPCNKKAHFIEEERIQTSTHQIQSDYDRISSVKSHCLINKNPQELPKEKLAEKSFEIIEKLLCRSESDFQKTSQGSPKYNYENVLELPEKRMLRSEVNKSSLYKEKGIVVEDDYSLKIPQESDGTNATSFNQTKEKSVVYSSQKSPKDKFGNYTELMEKHLLTSEVEKSCPNTEVCLIEEKSSENSSREVAENEKILTLKATQKEYSFIDKNEASGETFTLSPAIFSQNPRLLRSDVTKKPSPGKILGIAAEVLLGISDKSETLSSKTKENSILEGDIHKIQKSPKIKSETDSVEKRSLRSEVMKSSSNIELPLNKSCGKEQINQIHEERTKKSPRNFVGVSKTSSLKISPKESPSKQKNCDISLVPISDRPRLLRSEAAKMCFREKSQEVGLTTEETPPMTTTDLPIITKTLPRKTKGRCLTNGLKKMESDFNRTEKRLLRSEVHLQKSFQNKSKEKHENISQPEEIHLLASETVKSPPNKEVIRAENLLESPKLPTKVFPKQHYLIRKNVSERTVSKIRPRLLRSHANKKVSLKKSQNKSRKNLQTPNFIKQQKCQPEITKMQVKKSELTTHKSSKNLTKRRSQIAMETKEKPLLRSKMLKNNQTTENLENSLTPDKLLVKSKTIHKSPQEEQLPSEPHSLVTLDITSTNDEEQTENIKSSFEVEEIFPALMSNNATQKCLQETDCSFAKTKNKSTTRRNRSTALEIETLEKSRRVLRSELTQCTDTDKKEIKPITKVQKRNLRKQRLIKSESTDSLCEKSKYLLEKSSEVQKKINRLLLEKVHLIFPKFEIIDEKDELTEEVLPKNMVLNVAKIAKLKKKRRSKQKPAQVKNVQITEQEMDNNSRVQNNVLQSTQENERKKDTTEIMRKPKNKLSRQNTIDSKDLQVPNTKNIIEHENGGAKCKRKSVRWKKQINTVKAKNMVFNPLNRNNRKEVNNQPLLTSKIIPNEENMTLIKNTPKQESTILNSSKNINPNLCKNVYITPEVPIIVDKTQSCEISKSSNQNRTKLVAKRKFKLEENKSSLNETWKTNEIHKKADITIFDFDETEPEVVPLRLHSPKKDEAPKELKKLARRSKSQLQTKRQKLSDANIDDSKKAKVNLISMFSDKSQQKNINVNVRAKCPEVKATEAIQAQEVSPKQRYITNKGRKNSLSEKTNPLRGKASTSPMKQTMITDMFNKAVKEEQTSNVQSVFEVSSDEILPVTDMLPPKVEKKTLSNDREGLPFDDDSDCESRAEWMPEEYAEYKFKYSAKKMMTYTPIRKCKVCLLIFPSYYKLCKHKAVHAKTENPYQCPQCDQAFSSIDDLTAHLRIHKGKHPYSCKKCDQGFWSKAALDAHTPIHVLKKVKPPNKRFRCDVCAKEFSKLCDMERHTRVHTGEKPCVCNICNKRFQQSHNLSKHLLTHLHVKPYHCEICNKQFGRNDVLNRHLLTHSVDKPIKCPLCTKGFIRQSQLNNHMKGKHPNSMKIETKEEPTVVAN